MKYIKKFEKSNINDIYNYIDDNGLDSIENLIMIGVNFNIHTTLTPPLMYAMMNGTEDMVKLLISGGANIDSINYEGNTSLIRAAINNKFDMIMLLIELGANWNIINIYDHDFLEYLNNSVKRKIINKYPEKYKNYLIQKDAEKYNL